MVIPVLLLFTVKPPAPDNTPLKPSPPVVLQFVVSVLPKVTADENVKPDVELLFIVPPKPVVLIEVPVVPPVPV